MPNSGRVFSSNPHSVNKIGDLQKRAPKAVENLEQRVEKFAHPCPKFSLQKRLFHYAEPVAGLRVGGTLTQMGEASMPRLAEAVKETARRISRQLQRTGAAGAA